MYKDFVIACMCVVDKSINILPIALPGKDVIGIEGIIVTDMVQKKVFLTFSIGNGEKQVMDDTNNKNIDATTIDANVNFDSTPNAHLV